MFLNDNQIERNILMANRAERMFAHRHISINDAMAQVANLKKQSSRNREKVTSIDTGARRRRRRSTNVSTLAALEKGTTVVVRYTGATPFAAWLAVQRKRQCRPFCWRRLGERTNRYEVWVDDSFEASAPKALKDSVPSRDRLRAIVWNAESFSSEDYSLILHVLGTYRYVPRRGKSGGVLRRASEASGVPYHRVRTWMMESLKGKSLNRPDARFRRALRALFEAIADASDAWTIRAIHNKLKPGGTVECFMTERFKGLLDTALSRTYYKHSITKLRSGSPSLYRIRGTYDAPD